MSLTITLGSTVLQALEGTPQIQDTLDQRSTLTVTIYDQTGMLAISPTQPITVTDTRSVGTWNPTGVVFSGYVHDTQAVNLYPQPDKLITVQCIDEHYLADKRVAQEDFEDMFAGDIATHLLANYLAAEGVQGSYAYQRASTANDFSQGTLSNVIGATNVTDGDLELAPAGTPFAYTDAFLSGTLVATEVGSNGLVLAANDALALAGTSAQGVGAQAQASTTNNYTYLQIWSGSSAIASGDKLVYSIFIPSTNPVINGGIDAVLDNGTVLRSTSIADQQGLSIHPGTDLSGYANDQRYTRTFDLSSVAGRTIVSIMIALEGDNPGQYVIYVDHVTQQSSGGTVKTGFYQGVLQRNFVVSTVGYSAVSLTEVAAFMPTGNRITPAQDLSATGIARTSLLSWTSSLLAADGTLTQLSADAQGTNNTPYILIEASLDGGATWQTCTNHGGIPGLIAGMKLTGISLLLRQTLSLASADPTVTPVLQSLSVTIQPSYVATKLDVLKSWLTQANWTQSTTLTNLTAQSNNTVTLISKQDTWKNADLSGQTLFGTGTPTQKIITGQCVLSTTGTPTDAHVRMDAFGQWGGQDFVLETDVYVNAYGNYGFIYMTTNWNNGNNTFGYEVDVTTGSSNNLTLGYGSNAGSSGTFTTIASATVGLNAGEWHRLKLEYTHSSHTHKVSFDDVLYITAVDATYTAPGYVGPRYFNNTATTHSGFFQNFGIVQTYSGTWLSPIISLTSIGSALTSLIQWAITGSNNTSSLVEVTIDSGSTWHTCTLGAALPVIAAGDSLSGKAIQLRVTLTTNNGNTTPVMSGLSVWVLGAYSAQGWRVSPALNLNLVGRCGSTLVAWNANQPTATGVFLDTSLDNANWLQVGSGAQGNAEIAGINGQSEPIDDTFETNSAGLYSSTSATGGSVAAWTWDTANSRLIASGGSFAQLIQNSYQAADVDLVVDMDQSDSGGLTWRRIDGSNYYSLSVQDDTSPVPNEVEVFKTVGGVRASLGTGTIAFPRNTPHRIHVTMFGGTITVLFDEVVVFTYTDLFPLGAGQVGLRTDTLAGASTARFYQFRIQPQGDNVVGINVFTRVRLTSTDPTQTPQVLDVTTSVHSPDIQTGVLIPSTTYSVKNGSTNTIAQDLDDLARQSNYWWRIVMKRLLFRARNGILAPWILTGNDVSIGLGPLQVSKAMDMYRTSSWVLGGTDTQVQEEEHTCDGFVQSWTLKYPVDSITEITVDGWSYSFGIQNVDTGKEFYYTVGSNVITQDTGLIPFQDGQKLAITYAGQINVVANAVDPALVAAQAALDGTSGLIEVAESAPGLAGAAANQLAMSRIVQNGVIAPSITCTTMRPGLAVGQLLSVFLPAHQLTDEPMLITDVQTQYRTMVGSDGTLDHYPIFTISATGGPLIASYFTFVSGRSK